MLFVRNPTGVSHSPGRARRDRRLPGRGRRARRRRSERLAAMSDLAYWLERAWLDGGPSRDGVLVDVEDGRFTPRSQPDGGSARRRRPARRADAPRPRQLPQPRLPPGAARAHAARAAARSGPGASRCTPSPRGSTPDTYLALARATYRRDGRWPGSPASASSTTCTTGPDGTPYDDPNAMGAGAASRPPREAGLRITLLDTCYLAARDRRGRREGVQRAVQRRRRRRAGPTRVDALAGRPDDAADRRGDPLGARGARATRCAGRRRAARRAAAARAPLRAARRERRLPGGVRPAPRPQLLAEAGALGPRTTAVHATHLTDDDIALLGDARHRRLLLPDHRARPRPTASARPARCATPASPLTLGLRQPRGDRPVRGDARASRCDERLATQRARPLVAPPSCCDAATVDGHALARLGRRRPDRGRAPRRPGHRRHRTASAPPGPAPTRHRGLRGDRRRRRRTSSSTAGSSSPTGGTARRRRPRRWPTRSTAVWAAHEHATARHRHRRAGHQRPGDGDDLLGAGRATPRWSSRAAGSPGSGPAAQAPGRRRAASTSAAAPSSPASSTRHAHLVFAGDRAAEFAARMAGRAVRRRRHPHHRRGHPGRDRRAAAPPRSPRLVAEMRAPGHHHRRDQERLRAHRRRRGAQPARSPRAVHRRRPPSSARTSCRPSTPTTRRRTSTWSTGPMLDGLRAVRPLGRRVLRARAPFDADEARAVLDGRARRAGLRGRLHANQLGPGPGVRLAVELGAAAVDHCTYLDRRRRRRARATPAPSRRCCPASSSRTRSPYPDARRLLDAGVTVALATRLQPRLLLHLARCRSASRWPSARWG